MSPYSAVPRVYIAFIDPPTAYAPTWTEVTADVRSIRTNRGRSNELDNFSAGSLTVVLDNRSRAYDPDYTAGAYYGNLKVRRQIKIEAGYSAVTYPIFRGFIQSYQQNYPAAGKDATCTIQAVDLFGILSTYQLPDSAYELALRSAAPTVWYRLDDADGTMRNFYRTGNDGSYSAERTKVDALETGGAGASRVLASTGVEQVGAVAFTAALASSDKTSIAAIVKYVDGVGTIRLARLYDGSGNSVAMQVTNGVLAANATQNTPSNNQQPKGNAADGTHHVVITRNSSSVIVYIDGVSAASTSSFGTGSYAFTAMEVAYPTAVGYADVTIDELSVWESTELSSSQASDLAAAAVGWAGDYAVSRILRLVILLGFSASAVELGGTSSSSVGAFVGGTDATSYLQSVARSDGALLFVTRAGKLRVSAKTDSPSNTISFADDGSAGGVFYTGFGLSLDDRLVFNKVAVSGVSGASFTKENTASQADYAIRATSISTQLPTTNACRDVAESIALSHADPIVRGNEITVIPEVLVGGGGAKGWATVLGVELGDNATVIRTPPVGTAINRTVQITGISHAITPEQWTTQFTTAPGRTVTVFRWGTSNWDGTDTWS